MDRKTKWIQKTISWKIRILERIFAFLQIFGKNAHAKPYPKTLPDPSKSSQNRTLQAPRALLKCGVNTLPPERAKRDVKKYPRFAKGLQILPKFLSKSCPNASKIDGKTQSNEASFGGSMFSMIFLNSHLETCVCLQCI